MNSVISNTGKFAGGYFVLNKMSTESSFAPSDGFVVTCKQDKGLLNFILRLIDEANDYIKICSFIIDNKQIVESLKKRLKEGKISIFILTAVDDRSIKSDLLDEDETAELSKSRHFEFIDELVRVGAHVRASSSAHAKFVVKDGNEALLMSANLTEPSLNNNERGKHPNDESGVVIEVAVEIKTLERIFDSIFLYGTEFRKFLNIDDKTQLIAKNENEIRIDDFPTLDSNVIWSYESFHHLIYEKVNAAIMSGKNTIRLSTYSIVELNNLPELLESLKIFINIKKGSVKIFCRAMNHRPDHLQSCKILRDLGAEIYGDMFNHSKGISVDTDQGIIFTANIDGKHGLKSGFEVGYLMDNSNRSLGSFNSFLNYQIQSAPFVFVTSPEKNQVFEFYKLWYKEKEIKASKSLPESFEIKFRSSAMYAKEFEDAIINYPIFYTVLNRPEKKEIQFEINGKGYLLETLNETTFVVNKQLQQRDVVKGEKYILFYNKINLTMYEG